MRPIVTRRDRRSTDATPGRRDRSEAPCSHSSPPALASASSST